MSNNSATANAETADADLSVVKTLETSPVIKGKPVQWKVTVHNDGPATANDVLLTDLLPVPINDISVGTTQGTCATPLPGLPLLCDLGDMGDDGTVVVTIDAKVNANATGALGNSATAASPDESDPTDNGSNTTGDIEDEPTTTTTSPSTTQPTPPTTHELPSEPEHENPLPPPPGPKHTDRGPLAFTGFDSGGVAIFGLILLASGVGLTVVARRRRGEAS